MKKTKKIFYILAVMLVLFQSIIGIKNTYATSIGDVQYLERENKGFYSIQKWNGSEWIYVTYSITHYTDDQGNKRIAYCIDPDLKGIGWISGEYEGYDVQLESLISDERLWRVYTNGYPYKTPSEMGVETDEDAYLATKMAAYSILRSNTVEDIRTLYRAGCNNVEGESLEDIQRRGNKVIDAICNLVNEGYNGTSTPQYNSNISIKESSDFSEDNIDSNYCSKIFKVVSQIECKNYKVTELKGFPDGTYITDLDGNKQDTFNGNEEFKIMIPKDSLKDDIQGNISVEAVCKNYPIFYAKCTMGNYQNYMLCCDYYSDDIKGSADINITTNKSSIIINKVDKDNKNGIQGVQFDVTYEDGTKIGTFETDENGKITINDLRQGTILIKEVNTPSEYVLNEDLVRIDLKYEETKELTIENEKKKGSIKIIKVDSNNNEIKIPGAKFDIINDNDEVVGQLITDENGEAQIDNLPIDSKYKIKETETAKEYILSDEVVTVTLEENEIKTLTFKNKKKEQNKEETLPRTGEIDVSNYLLGISMACITVDYKLLKKKK